MNMSGEQDLSDHDHTHNGNQNQAATEAAPDIERILAELAGYSASNNTSQPAATASFSINQTAHHALSLALLPTAHSVPPALQPQQYTVTPPPQPQSPMINPATIFEWPQALRCVNKISATNPQFGPAIKTVSSPHLHSTQS
jgi:hypothetical protein